MYLGGQFGEPKVVSHASGLYLGMYAEPSATKYDHLDHLISHMLERYNRKARSFIRYDF